MKFHLISGAALICLSACAQDETPPAIEAEPPPEAAASEPAAMPTNATIVETYFPRSRVEGAPVPLPENSDARLADAEVIFADAIAYAEETTSYALLIWHNGALQLETYFPPHTEEVRSEPASMHKSVLGLVTAKAIADGVIESADTQISTWLPEWEDDPRGEITLRQLLTMSAGLAPLTYEGGAASPAVRFASGEDDTVETLLSLPLEEASAPHFHYQNTVSQLLMLVVTRALGEPYQDYLSREIWQPIGAADAYTYDFNEEGFPRGYASLLARPLDWLRLGLLIKQDGVYDGEQIVPAAAIENMTAPSALNPNYGWQIWRGAQFEAERYYNFEGVGFAALSSEPYLTDDLIFFDGFGGQRVYISKAEDLVIVRLGDSQTGWDDSRLPNAVIRALDAQD